MSDPRAPEPVESDPLETALRRARAGDEAGFLVLWQTLQPRLLRYLQLRAGAGRQDVAAETWLHVVRDLHSFRGDATDFRRWLFTLARHRAVDAARHHAVRPLILVADVSLVSGQPMAASAEDEALERLSTERALALLACLPPDQADMVALRVLAGLDVAMVAVIVGKSPGAVRVGVHRALRQLSTSHQVENVEVM